MQSTLKWAWRITDRCGNTYYLLVREPGSVTLINQDQTPHSLSCITKDGAALALRLEMATSCSEASGILERSCYERVTIEYFFD